MVCISVIYNNPIAAITTLLTSPFVMVSLNIYMDDLFDYLKILRNRFKLYITHEIFNDSDNIISISRVNGVDVVVSKLELTTKEFYKYHCKGLCLKIDKEKAKSFFLDPMKPTINELTLFELCGYSKCIQTFGEPYDYSKSFDELFGYYMQQGLINKIKYIFKNRDRLKIRK